MLFSIIIPTSYRPQLLEKCLQSLASQNIRDAFEVIICINGNSNRKLEHINKNFFDLLPVRIIDLEERNPSIARNEGIKIAKGQYIWFLDDDVIVPEGYYKKWKKYTEHNDWDILGGPDLTPTDASFFERSLGNALASKACSGKTNKRHRKNSTDIVVGGEDNLILCNLWIRKEILESFEKPFDENLLRCEENLLLYNLSRQNLILTFYNELYVYHVRRKTHKQFFSIGLSSGYFRMQLFDFYPTYRDKYYLLPLFFLFMHIFYIFPVLWIVWPIYWLFNFIMALKVSYRDNFLVGFPLVMFLQYSFVVAYGIGELIYLINKLLFGKPKF